MKLNIIDTKGDSGDLLFSGRPFLSIRKAKIGVETGEFILNFNKKRIIFKVYDETPYVENLDTCYYLDEKGSKEDKGKIRGEVTGVRVSFAPDVP